MQRKTNTKTCHSYYKHKTQRSQAFLKVLEFFSPKLKAVKVLENKAGA